MAAKSKNINEAAAVILQRRNFCPHPQKGAVMSECTPKLMHMDKSVKFSNYKDELEYLLKDIDVYYPKNQAHFWIGKVYEPHVTYHHGFELKHYEKGDGNGADEFTKDVETIIEALDKDDLEANPDRQKTFRERLESGEMTAKPGYFPSNPALTGEDEYYTVILRGEPSDEMLKFRSALLRILPHTMTFPEWSVHTSICTVASVEARDKLIAKLQDSTLVLKGIKYGYNIKPGSN